MKTCTFLPTGKAGNWADVSLRHDPSALELATRFLKRVLGHRDSPSRYAVSGAVTTFQARLDSYATLVVDQNHCDIALFCTSDRPGAPDTRAIFPDAPCLMRGLNDAAYLHGTSPDENIRRAARWVDCQFHDANIRVQLTGYVLSTDDHDRYPELDGYNFLGSQVSFCQPALLK